MLPFIHISDLSIPSYGLLMAIGLVFGSLLFYFLARKNGIDGLNAFILISYSSIAALAGAKLLAVLTTLKELSYLWNTGHRDVFLYYLVNGGMVFYGGVIAGLITFILVVKHNKIPLLSALDIAAPAVAFGHFFGRLGCFAVGCCYGVPHAHAGISFEFSPIAPNGVALLPVQLFEAAFNIFLAIILIVVVRKGKEGLSASLYLLAYSCWRFIIEFWRGDSYRGFLLGLSTSQWISMLMFIMSLALLSHSLVKKNT